MANPKTEQHGGINIYNSTVNVSGDFVGGDYTRITNNFFGDPSHARNRRDMLELVTNTWIKGVLDQSLYNQVWIELGLETQPGAVERSWGMQLEMPDQPAQELPPGTPIVQLFDQLNGALLILGAPGAGKTTILLQLARDLIARAATDPLMRIPVVLNLSSWSDPKQTIADWLVFALNSQYQVPKKIAQAWVEQDALLLLLDGLDEVKSERRDACVKAINAFRDEHGMMPLVVCSRIADYQALTQRLVLRGAVLIQPLTRAQIESYLDRAGPELSAVRQTLAQDIMLQELVEQPLLLSIMTLAYRGVPVTDLTGESISTLTARRKHLFDSYIERMFHRVARTKNELYSPAQTKHWLNWLAQKMIEQGQSIFYLEALRRSWLHTHTGQRLAGILAGVGYGLIFGSVFGLVFGLGLGLVSGLGEWLEYGMVSGLVTGLEYGLGTGLEYGLGTGLGVGLVYGLVYGLVRRLVSRLVRGLVFGLISGLAYGLVSALVGELVNALVGGLVTGLVGGLIVGVGSRDEEPAERVSWRWQKARSGFLRTLGIGLGVGLGVGLVSGLGVGLVSEWDYGLADVLGVGLVLGLFPGLGVGLVLGLLGGLESGTLETKSVPNQGIRQSTKNAIIYGLVSGLVSGLVFSLGVALVTGLVSGPQYGMADMLVLGLISGLGDGLKYGLIVALGVGLVFGGAAGINHYVIRFLLSRDNAMPLNYVRFLDYASERIFLRKVGGGYIFIHRMLMEHFAAMEAPSNETAIDSK